MRARLVPKGLDHSIVNLGEIGMSRLRRTLAATALSLATLVPAGYASAADMAVKALTPVAEVPFFLVIDNRVSFSWMPKGTDPGMFSINPDGSINGTTAKQVYSFTHFDAWAYGTNFFTISLFKSGQKRFRFALRSAWRHYHRRCRQLRRRNRNLRSVPLDLRLQRNLQYQGLHHGAAA